MIGKAIEMVNSKNFTWMVNVVLIVSALSFLYYETFIGLINDWKSNDNYSHGFFIPLISGYMIYTLRLSFDDILIRPVNIGLLLILLGLCQLIIARIGSEFFLDRTSLIIVLSGISLFLLGTKWLKKLMVPIIYLIFMIPLPEIIWNRIAFPMQLFASFLTSNVIDFLGIPVLRQGNILHLANTTLEVVGACSGLRSLVTMFALSSALAWFGMYSKTRKLLLVLCAAPIAILVNIIRLTITAILSATIGEQAAQGFLHDFSGMLIFCLGLLLLWLMNYFFTKFKT